MTLSFTTKSAEESEALGQKIGRFLQKGDILAMRGPLAAGKMPLYHMDVYRLDGTEDFINLGTDDMLYGEGVCVIEWSEKIMSELPDTAIVLDISVNGDGSRTVLISNWPHEAIR